jgi:hypothetical protein
MINNDREFRITEHGGWKRATWTAFGIRYGLVLVADHDLWDDPEALNAYASQYENRINDQKRAESS